jgi:DNA modification methylase
MARPIRHHGTQDDAVYDPFGGSGTTLVAAEQAGRSAFVMELDPRYVDVAVARWEAFTGQTADRVGADDENTPTSSAGVEGKGEGR